MVTVTGDSLGSRTVITNGMVEGHHQIHTITFQGAVDSESEHHARRSIA
jgi:hypothetical protein